LKKSIQLFDELNDGTSNNISESGQNRRRTGMWITDAIYMVSLINEQKMRYFEN
jgi:hypothetical protein